jgi:NTP pyrophosphatase (non-canonical NTP hydrolase)
MTHIVEFSNTDTKQMLADPFIPDNMKNGLDYQAETDKTASKTYNGSTTPLSELASDLRIFIAASQKLDKHKKVLFRKRSRADAGFSPGTEIDPWNPVATVGTVFDEYDEDLLHGVIGVATESGELAEIVYKKLILGGEIDITNVREEIGDVLWYLSRLIKYSGTTWLTEMKRNINKLRLRHGATFDAARDANRDLSAERTLLEEKPK